MENRQSLAVDGLVSHAKGTAERGATLAMLDRRPRRRRIRQGTDKAADKAYDVRGFGGHPRERRVTPHIAVDGHLIPKGVPRSSAIDASTRRHAGYGVSQRCRKRIEDLRLGQGRRGLGQVRLRGRARVDAVFTLVLAAYNLIRLPKLLATPA